MKAIFYIYWALYTLLVFAYSNASCLLDYLSMFIPALLWVSLMFVLSAPVYVVIYGLKKSSRNTDPKYLNMCLYAGLIRGFICIFSYFGLTSQVYVWAISIFGFAFYLLLDKMFSFKNIHTDYFNY